MNIPHLFTGRTPKLNCWRNSGCHPNASRWVITAHGAKENRRVAYFSMEVAVGARMPTYSGCLGVLAGDTLKSCTDLRVPVVAVSLLYRKGYFDRQLDERGEQQEYAVQWDPAHFLRLLPDTVQGDIEQRPMWILAWQYDI